MQKKPTKYTMLTCIHRTFSFPPLSSPLSSSSSPPTPQQKDIAYNVAEDVGVKLAELEQELGDIDLSLLHRTLGGVAAVVVYRRPVGTVPHQELDSAKGSGKKVI